MGSLESLKQIADYRENLEGVYLSKSTFGIGTSRALTVAENGEGKTGIAVAPRSFFGRLFAWVVPYRGGATGADYLQQNKLKKAIEEHLVTAGMNTNQAKHIVEQVVGDNPLRAITRSDLRQIIGKAKTVLAAKNSLAQKKSMVMSASSSTLAETIHETTGSVVSEEGSISGEESFRDVDPLAEKKAEEFIQDSKLLLKEMTFDPKEVFELRKTVERQRIKVEAYFYECSPGSKGEQNLDKLEKKLGISLVNTEKPVLPPNMLLQLGEQRALLSVKEKMLSQYLEDDPFSDKNVQYLRRIYAEAAKLVFNKKEQSKEARACFGEWYQGEVDSYEQADPVGRSHPPTFYLDNKNWKNPLVKYNAGRVVDVLEKLALARGIAVDVTTEEVNQAAGIAMNQFLDWEKTELHMVFSIGEVTRAYAQVSTPLSKSQTAVGAHLRAEKIGGIIPSVRDDGRTPINTRLTQLFRIENRLNPETGEKEEKKILLHERQQHGINDHFAIQNPRERHKANLNSMKQLIQSGAEADPVFIKKALQQSEQPAQLFYINTNLTTPTWTPRGNKNNEEAYSRHQGAAMRAIEGVQTFSVLNPDNSEGRADINLNVTCIDFRFPVNYAISSFSEDKRSIDPGMIPAWPELKAHNEGEFKKLFGSLDDKAPIGGIMESTYQKLENEIKSGNQDALKLKTEIDQQITYVRNMFRTEAYKTAGEDRFKMPRHIDLLVNAFRRASELVDDHKVRVVNAGGCMSGKDREGVANAENEAAIIIQDLGGNVEPDEGRRYHEETQAIYDSCMTGVVQNTRQVTGIGGSKNAEEIANQMSDPHAKIYAQGGAKFVTA